MMSVESILPVILGFDIADYAFARIFHERTGSTSLVVSEFPRGPINNSSILTRRIVPRGTLADDSSLLHLLNKIEEENPEKHLLLLVNTDDAVKFIAAHRDQLGEKWILPYSQPEVIETANSKENFAQLCEKLGLRVPVRNVISILDKSSWLSSLENLTFPIVVKPLQGSDLEHYTHKGLPKISVHDNRESVLALLERLRENTVDTSLMCQELIPGDDTTQWVVNGYVDKQGRVSAVGSGRVLLGLHQPRYLGNAAAILTEYNEKLISDAIALVREAHIHGFFSFDIKVNPYNNMPYWFDLNPRIGRSHYYMKVAGIDLVQALLDDFMGYSDRYQTNTTEGIYSVIPSCFLSSRYLRDRELYNRVAILKRRREGIVHPLAYRADRNIRRWIYRMESLIQQGRLMRRWYPEPTESGF